MLTPMSRSQSLRQPMVVLALSTALMGTFYFTSLRNSSPRLISYNELPADMVYCDYDSSAEPLPGLPGETLPAAALLQDRVEQTAASSDIASRPPVRMIRDPNSAYSAVAVDTVDNEVVMTDENLFNIITYDRQTNTPP